MEVWIYLAGLTAVFFGAALATRYSKNIDRDDVFPIAFASAIFWPVVVPFAIIFWLWHRIACGPQERKQ